jgi:hypothetical protein
MSALPPRADMCGATRDVRFGPKADMWRQVTACASGNFHVPFRISSRGRYSRTM